MVVRYHTHNTALTDPQMLNSYSYGRNNPITMSDPSGLWAVSYSIGFSSEVGIGAGTGGSVSFGGAFASGVKGTQGTWTGSYGSFFGTKNNNITSANSNYSPSGELGILGAYVGLGISVSYSPTAQTVDEIVPNNTSSVRNVNIPDIKIGKLQLPSLGTQTSKGNGTTLNLGPGFGASTSNYPIKTVNGLSRSK